MTPTRTIANLVDVDNTAIDNDGIQQDPKDRLEQLYGMADPKALASFPPADVTVESIADLLDYDLSRLHTAAPPHALEHEAAP